MATFAVVDSETYLVIEVLVSDTTPVFHPLLIVQPVDAYPDIEPGWVYDPLDATFREPPPSEYHEWDPQSNSYLITNLAGARLFVLDQVKEIRSDLTSGGVVYNGATYQTGPIPTNPTTTYEQNYFAALQLVTVGMKTPPVEVLDADNMAQSLTEQNLKDLCTLVADFLEALNAVAYSLRTQIFASSDPFTIDIETPWPGVPYAAP